MLALLALMNYWSNPAYAKAPDWRALARVIQENAQPGDLVLQNFQETSLVYYDQSKLPLVVYPETYFADDATDRSLKTLNQDQQRVWFIPSAGGYWDPDEYVETWLNRRADLQREWHIGDFRLRLYSTPADFQDTMSPSGAEFGDLLSLSGYRTTLDGDALKVALYWQVLKKPRENFEMRMQLVEPGKGVVAEAVQIPVWGEYPTTEWRKKELIVDQYDFGNVPTATQLLVSVCHVETDSCLRLNRCRSISG
jgi:hypothetical protein